MLNIRQYLSKVSKTKMAIFIALLVTMLFSISDYMGFFSTYESKMLDSLFVLRNWIVEPDKPSSEDKIIILAIDDQSVKTEGRQWPWPRSVYAKIIDKLSGAGARVIAFDLVFSEPSQADLEKEDSAFADAIVRSRSWIVLGSKFLASKTHAGVKTGYKASYAEIDPGKTHVGYVNYWGDKDSIIRHAKLISTYNDKLYFSFVLKILSRFHKIDASPAKFTKNQLVYGPLKIKVKSNKRMLINYRGGHGRYYTISCDNLFDDDAYPMLVERGTFKDKIVLVGPTFAESQDFHSTPFSGESGLVSGVEIHANVLETIYKNKYYTVASDLIHVLIYLLVALGLALIYVRLKPIKSLFVMLSTMILYFVFAAWLFISFRVVVHMFHPMIMVMTGTYLGVLVYLLVTEERQSRFIKGMFSRYVSPKVVDQLVQDPNAELKLGGTRQFVTVLFSDVRGFTTLSEELPAEEVVDLLNEYFQTWTDIIFKYDGTVDKFIGDAVMAIFGAPVRHSDDAKRALMAVLDMREALGKLQEKWKREGKRSINIGVGLNTGEAIVGNIGSQQAMGYTVIGDTVNVAARLESKTKDFGAFLLISESTYAAVKDIVEVKEHAGVTVKGKAAAFSVYEVLGLKAST